MPPNCTWKQKNGSTSLKPETDPTALILLDLSLLFCYTGTSTAVDLFVSQFADFSPALLSLMNFNDIRWDVSSADINYPHLLILVFSIRMEGSQCSVTSSGSSP
jgi:hypothetical protein